MSGLKQKKHRSRAVTIFLWVCLIDLTHRCHVYLSPVFGSIEPAEIVDFMQAHTLNDVTLQLQMHKFIWDPNKRGV